MNGPKLLIDTNIVIGLEDNREIEAPFSKLLQQCQKHGVRIYVHEASKQDIGRDKNTERQQIILSKLEKFLPLDNIPIPPVEELASLYGQIGKDNDHIDAILLHTLDRDIVDFLITQDLGIHRRASNVELGDRVFRVEDALVWLRDTFENIPVTLPYIEEKQCHQLEPNDEIFVSLRGDYTGFDEWFRNSCIKNQRECWTIHFDNEIAGIAIRKDEEISELFLKVKESERLFLERPSKTLKICTLKIKEKFRGEKLGEQLLKQILWWAHKNNYSFVYLTVYPKYDYLIDMLMRYGFRELGKADDEIYLGKVFDEGILASENPNEPLSYHRQYYPSFLSDKSVGKYLIPIKGGYYSTLFPENHSPIQFGLFNSDGGLGFQGDGLSKIPGNTIRKVYVCHAQIKKIKLGDILLFFHLKDDTSIHSQTLITVGIVDGFDVTSSTTKLMKLTAKRSVFSPSELEELTEGDVREVKVINFLLAGHINPAILFEHLESIGIKGPYQSIRTIDHNHYLALEKDIILDVKSA